MGIIIAAIFAVGITYALIQTLRDFVKLSNYNNDVLRELAEAQRPKKVARKRKK